MYRGQDDRPGISVSNSIGRFCHRTAFTPHTPCIFQNSQDAQQNFYIPRCPVFWHVIASAPHYHLQFRHAVKHRLSSLQHHLHRPPSTTCTSSQRQHRRQVIPVCDQLHYPPACNTAYTTRQTSYTTSQRIPTLPSARNTTRRGSLTPPVSDQLHYPMTNTEDSEPEVEL